MNIAVFDTLDPHNLRRARKRLRRLARHAPKQLAEAARHGQAVARTAAEQARVRPLMAAAVAFGVGLTAGALVATTVRR
jgi:ElaB/YqjD/DUF883 family membrane-anchored ribosome-binding protein